MSRFNEKLHFLPGRLSRGDCATGGGGATGRGAERRMGWKRRKKKRARSAEPAGLLGPSPAPLPASVLAREEEGESPASLMREADAQQPKFFLPPAWKFERDDGMYIRSMVMERPGPARPHFGRLCCIISRMDTRTQEAGGRGGGVEPRPGGPPFRKEGGPGENPSLGTVGIRELSFPRSNNELIKAVWKLWLDFEADKRLHKGFCQRESPLREAAEAKEALLLPLSSAARQPRHSCCLLKYPDQSASLHFRALRKARPHFIPGVELSGGAINTLFSDLA